MKRKLRQLSTLFLAVLAAASIAAPAFAAWPPVMTWQPKTNIIKASKLPSSAYSPSASAPSETVKPSEPSSPVTSAAPVTPAAPAVSTAPAQSASGSASSLEQQVVSLVNRQRAAYGLGALTLNTALSDGARRKAQDMRDNRYFDHNSPTYGSPFNMMRSLGITYRAAGENIAMGFSSAEAVVSAWMNSPTHRANILDSRYSQIGVGYVSSGGYWVQWFTN